MKKILFLTNTDNGASEEDEMLIKFLADDFDLAVMHPRDCSGSLQKVDGVIIRNVWPTHEYNDEWERAKKAILDSGLPTYNPLTGRGDNAGKGYLIELYEKGFPVIPSVDNIEKIGNLPECELCWIKLKDSCDGIGSKKMKRSELMKTNLQDYIVQPFVEFTSEPSFYFINNEFSYSITMPNRLADKDITLYEPLKSELIFAQKFVDWNGLRCGIQRIDAVRTLSGELLLTEVEDISPYLYLLDIDESVRCRVVTTIRKSVSSAFSQDQSR